MAKCWHAYPAHQRDRHTRTGCPAPGRRTHETRRQRLPALAWRRRGGCAASAVPPGATAGRAGKAEQMAQAGAAGTDRSGARTSHAQGRRRPASQRAGIRAPHRGAGRGCRAGADDRAWRAGRQQFRRTGDATVRAHRAARHPRHRAPAGRAACGADPREHQPGRISSLVRDGPAPAAPLHRPARPDQFRQDPPGDGSPDQGEERRLPGAAAPAGPGKLRAPGRGASAWSAAQGQPDHRRRAAHHRGRHPCRQHRRNARYPQPGRRRRDRRDPDACRPRPRRRLDRCGVRRARHHNLSGRRPGSAARGRSAGRAARVPPGSACLEANEAVDHGARPGTQVAQSAARRCRDRVFPTRSPDVARHDRRARLFGGDHLWQPVAGSAAGAGGALSRWLGRYRGGYRCDCDGIESADRTGGADDLGQVQRCRGRRIAGSAGAPDCRAGRPFRRA